MHEPRTLGLVGARGHTGAELVRLLARHPRLRLARAASRSSVGSPLATELAGAPEEVVLEAMSPETVAAWPVDALVLALPNDLSGPYVDAVDDRYGRGRGPVIVDLSADHRFDDEWAYGLPERHRARILGSRRIANPGCYATGIQLGVAPALPILGGPPVAFGVSGYSGAGTTPSPRNDPERLRDNLMSYALTGHVHEREASRHLGHSVRFTPHVAPFFRGISLTIALPFARAVSIREARARYEDAYAREPLVVVQGEIPEVARAAGEHRVWIGGFACDGDHAVVVVTLDNLLKGAATQALQNLNLALGLGELEGIDDDPASTTLG
ncbi:MAG: N-acetyl-gamma-glutamyl-phosphate reductase [Nannocystaceae bacterium]